MRGSKFLFAAIIISSCGKYDKKSVPAFTVTESTIVIKQGKRVLSLEKHNQERCDDKLVWFNDSSKRIYFNLGCREIVLVKSNNLTIANKLVFSENEFNGKNLVFDKKDSLLTIMKGNSFIVCSEDLTSIFIVSDSIYQRNKLAFDRKEKAYRYSMSNDSIFISFDVLDPNFSKGTEEIYYKFKLNLVEHDSAFPIQFMQNHEPIIEPRRILKG